MGPRSPYSATNLLMDSGAREWEVTGGPAALVGSLVSAAEAAGVRMLTGTEALGIELSAERVTGVRVDGEILAGDVLMTGAPTGLLTLLPAWRMPARMVRELENIRTRGTCAKLHLALNAPMVVAARKASFDHMLLGAEHPLDLERCFDDAKHRRLPRRPWLDVRQLTGDCAPAGHAVLSIMVHCAAHDLDGGWTPGAREALKQSVLAVLAESDPDIAAKVVHAELLAPSDLEQRYGLVGGHLFHGERMVDQWYAMRPSLHLSRHATDLPGLFLGSMGTHPGGGITGGPGLLAAERMLSVSGAS